MDGGFRSLSLREVALQGNEAKIPFVETDIEAIIVDRGR